MRYRLSMLRRLITVLFGRRPQPAPQSFRPIARHPDGSIRYADTGHFERAYTIEADPPSILAMPEGWLVYQAGCGACIFGAFVFVDPATLDELTIPAGVGDLVQLGWSIAEGRIRCPMCSGAYPRPYPRAYPALPEPPRGDARRKSAPPRR